MLHRCAHWKIFWLTQLNPDLISHEIQEWPDADYRYRVIIDQKELAQLMAVLAGTLDYGNFKSMIAATPGQRGKLHAYHEIWGVMANLKK